MMPGPDVLVLRLVDATGLDELTEPFIGVAVLELANGEELERWTLRQGQSLDDVVSAAYVAAALHSVWITGYRETGAAETHRYTFTGYRAEGATS